MGAMKSLLRVRIDPKAIGLDPEQLPDTIDPRA
jgi:hypothetical protein